MFNFKKAKGFTLIELLIVVAIIGILAALLIPNAMSAIQKAKQKGSMKDINTISTAIMDYVTDRGRAPLVAADGTAGFGAVIDGATAFLQEISPFYLRSVPIFDQWAFSYFVGTGPACSSNVWITLAEGETWGADDFVVGSNGRNGTADDEYDPAAPGSGFYEMTGMADFNRDLVSWSGAWVIAPAIATASGGGD